MALSFSEAYALQKKILEGAASGQQLLTILTEFDRTLEYEEFYGLYKASEDAMNRVASRSDLLDTCGTGGDGLHTFNISTAPAILSAALGVAVAKHGNRSASSQCGSADVLEELGIPIDVDATRVSKCIEETGFGFMYAPRFHPAFGYAASARKAFGKRTYFNFLGPLLNPANAAFRLVGVSDPMMIDLMGRTLMKAGATKAWLVHSHDGMDEISTSGDTTVVEYSQSADPRTFTINPVAYNLASFPSALLRGGDKKYNAEIIRNILNGRGTDAQNAAVVANTAAGLVIVGKVKNYSDGLMLAIDALKRRLGMEKLTQIVDCAAGL